MTFSLGQALVMLELPQAELSTWLLAEIEKNPLLELDSLSPSLTFKDVAQIEAPKTLYDHLIQQIRERFSNPHEQLEAIGLLENLDERGFLSPAFSDSPILSVLQTFDPPGVFARDLRECLLLQLEPTTSAYQIISLCFQDLLHGRFKAIQKKTGIQDLSLAIQSLSRLNFRPAELFRHETNHPVIADLRISKQGKSWLVESNDEELPKFHLRNDYLSLPLESSDEKETLRRWAASGKWLLRSLKRRKSILLEIGVFLVRKQAAFLDQKGELEPLSIKELADHVELHESTLSRALAGKYADTPRGVLPLRSLISAPSDSAKIALEQLIAQEDKKKPLTDGEIVAELQKMGKMLARRTVSKYRSELKIGSAIQRKHTKM